MARAMDADVKVGALSDTCAECRRHVKKGWGFGFKAVSAEVNRDTQAQSSDILKCLFCAIAICRWLDVLLKWRL